MNDESHRNYAPTPTDVAALLGAHDRVRPIVRHVLSDEGVPGYVVILPLPSGEVVANVPRGDDAFVLAFAAANYTPSQLELARERWFALHPTERNTDRPC